MQRITAVSRLVLRLMREARHAFSPRRLQSELQYANSRRVAVGVRSHAPSALTPFPLSPPRRLQSELQYANSRRVAAEAELAGNREEAARPIQAREGIISRVGTI